MDRIAANVKTIAAIVAIVFSVGGLIGGIYTARADVASMKTQFAEDKEARRSQREKEHAAVLKAINELKTDVRDVSETLGKAQLNIARLCLRNDDSGCVE